MLLGAEVEVAEEAVAEEVVEATEAIEVTEVKEEAEEGVEASITRMVQLERVLLAMLIGGLIIGVQLTQVEQ